MPYLLEVGLMAVFILGIVALVCAAMGLSIGSRPPVDCSPRSPADTAGARRMQEECDNVDEWMRAELKQRIENAMGTWPERFDVKCLDGHVCRLASRRQPGEGPVGHKGRVQWVHYSCLYGHGASAVGAKDLVVLADHKEGVCLDRIDGLLISHIHKVWLSVERRVAEQAAREHKEKMTEMGSLMMGGRPVIEQRRAEAASGFLGPPPNGRWF